MVRTSILALALLVAACGSVPGPAGCLAGLNLPAPVVTRTGGCQTSISADRSTYATGEKIVMTLTTTATGPNCGVGVPCGQAAVSIADSQGQVVWKPVHLGIACPDLARLLKIGESVHSTATWERPTLAAGGYSVSGEGARAWFRVC